VIDTGRIVGYDRAGRNTSYLTLISHPEGRIETAFPGIMLVRPPDIPDGEQDVETKTLT